MELSSRSALFYMRIAIFPKSPEHFLRPKSLPGLRQTAHVHTTAKRSVPFGKNSDAQLQKASSRRYQTLEAGNMTLHSGSGPPAWPAALNIPGLTMLSQSPQTSSSYSQSQFIPSNSKGRKSKHAQRIAAATAASKQSSTNQARPQPGPVPQPHRAGTPSKRVEHDPQWQNDNSRPRAAPSVASGGVPDPTTQYLAQALVPSKALPSPRRILVIIDLNGTLLYRPSRRRPFDFVQRPHAREFLSYCLDTFYVAIWSSAKPDNVRKMVAQLLEPAQIKRCVLVWARDRFGLDSKDYDTRVQCYKRLSMVWADPAVQASHPVAGARWDQTNTVLVDDSLEKGRSEPFNILSLPEFSGMENEIADVLPQVHDYLNGLCWQSDISSHMRQNQFRLDPSYVLPS